MSVIIERRSSAAASWARRLAVFSAVLLVTAGAGHRFGAVETPPFFWVMGLVASLTLIALVLAATGFMQLWESGDRGGRSSTAAVLIAVLVLGPFGYVSYLAFSLPRLHDISTDPLDPPVFLVAGGLRDGTMNELDAYPAGNAAQQAASYADITGRRYVLTAATVQDLVVQTLLERGWRIVRGPGTQIETGESTVEAVAHSMIFGLVSDVAIRITDEGETAYVDMRSTSRYGVHDIGTNAGLMRRFLAELDTAVANRAATGLQPAE